MVRRGYHRIVSVSGEWRLQIRKFSAADQQCHSGKPYEVDHFDGGVPTVSYGKVVDFNLMLKNGARGRMEALCLEIGQEWKVTPEKDENFLAIYVREGSVLIGDVELGPHELGVIRQWNTKAEIKVAARKQSRLGICRAGL